MNTRSSFARLHQRLHDGLRLLPDKPEETPDSTLRALWSAVAGAPASATVASRAPLATLDDAAMRRLESLIERRLAGVPLAHLTGRQHFMGIEMLAGPQALIPRRETELLGRAAVALARELHDASGSALAIDVCTGSGNLALALAHHVDGLRVAGADLSDDAIALARRNAGWLGLDGRVEFHAGDLLAPFDTPAFLGHVDLLVCNPPYISSGKVGAMAGEIAAHEPALAFDGGPLGVSILMRLLQDAPRFLRAGGWLGFEVGLGQGTGIARRMRNDAGWAEIREIDDDAGQIRALLARRKG